MAPAFNSTVMPTADEEGWLGKRPSGRSWAKTGSVCCYRIRVPALLFVLVILILFALAALCAVFVIDNVVLTGKMQWKPPPLILVPGLMGSKLYVEGYGIDYPKGLSNCSRNIPLRKSWISENLMNDADCEIYLLSLDKKSGENHNGIRVTADLRGVPFGNSIWPVQCTFTDEQPQYCDISTKQGNGESYFRKLNEFLMAKLRYQPGSTLFAAQYDWRQNQQSKVMKEYYENLKFLIERAHNLTEKKAILLGHSMGNIVISRFLNDKVSEDWQKEYLSATVNVAAPFGGAVDTMFGLLTGKHQMLPNGHSITRHQFLEFTRSSGFPANLLPFKNAFGDEPLLTVGDRNYSVNEMEQFLKLVGAEHLFPLYQENEPVPSAHIPMHCAYGVSQQTSRKFLYNGTNMDEPTVIQGDGDGTVNIESLRVCRTWKEQQYPVADIREFPGVRHTEIIMDRDFLSYLADILTSY